MNATTEAMVRAAGQDLDDMGPPGLGRVYLVLEVPTAEGVALQRILKLSRVGIVELPDKGSK